MSHENLIIPNTSTTISPPSPPTPIEEIKGNFSYITDINSRQMLNNAYNAICQTETWDFVKQDIESFMFSSDSRIDKISAKMNQLGYDGHSGASFGWTMRNMQYIAKYGEQQFKNNYLKNNS